MSQSLKCELHQHFAALAAELPVEDKPAFKFSSERCSDLPSSLETGRLIIRKMYRECEGSRVDRLILSAHKETFQELGLLILWVVFRKDGVRISLSLSNPVSTIRRLIIEYQGLTDRGALLTRPERFRFYGGRGVDRHPWAYENTSNLFALPRFKLTNSNDCLLNEEDWAGRDTVVGFGNDDASVRLAEVLLRFGSPKNETVEMELEGEGGFRGVGLHSAEASFHLPGSLWWPDEAD